VGWTPTRTSHHELLVDTGGAWFGDDDLRWLVGTASYQAVFAPRAETTGLFNVGGGFVHRGVRNDSAWGATLGAGVGLRHLLAGGHGLFREELRFDWTPRAEGLPRREHGLGPARVRPLAVTESQSASAWRAPLED
jgi:hypothetical protein